MTMTRVANLVVETPSPKSILGNGHTLFQHKTPKNGSIVDRPTSGLIEFYPAGYTKPAKDGTVRQDIFKTLYDCVALFQPEDTLYPFGQNTDGHSIRLVAEPTNQYDPNAIKVLLTIKPGAYTLPKSFPVGKEIDIGYVPMKVSKYLAPNLSMIKGGRILKVRNNMHGKYYGAKIVISYGELEFLPINNTTAARFACLLED